MSERMRLTAIQRYRQSSDEEYSFTVWFLKSLMFTKSPSTGISGSSPGEKKTPHQLSKRDKASNFQPQCGQEQMSQNLGVRIYLFCSLKQLVALAWIDG